MKIGQISFFRLTTAAETPYGVGGQQVPGPAGPHARAGSSEDFAAS